MGLSGKLANLFRQGYNELPELYFAGAATLGSIVYASARLYQREKNGENNKVYKLIPTYMRPDDPRAAKVHKV